MSEQEVLDCAIVGGGVSGLYAAWRLSQGWAAAGRCSGPPPFRIFEMTDRVGGRLYTTPVDGLSASVELGAMRFWPGQRLLFGFINKFNIPTEPFPSDTLCAAYLRGMHLSPDDFTRGNIPFRLVGDEASKDPGTLLAYAMEKLVPGVLSMTEAQLGQIESKQIPLGEVGFWNALERVLSNEAYQLLFTGSGIASVFSNWSATEGMKLMARIIGAFGSGGLLRPARGWSEVPDTLHSAYAAAGGRVSFGRRLVSLEHDEATQRFRLGFADTDEWGSDAVVEWVESRKVILALPQHALQLLVRGISLLATPTLRYLLQSVDAVSAFRMYFVYDTPWWTQWGVHGYTVTDQPISQVFYGMGLNGSETDKNRVLMASYADSFHWQFWAPLVEYSPSLWARLVKHGHTRTPLGSANPPPEDPSLAIQQVLHQLGRVHGINVPAPVQTIHKDWGAVGGAWHAWRAGVPVRDFVGMVRQPAPGLPIAICGEAFSYMQGWVEGALTQTERTLQSPLFNLAPPIGSIPLTTSVPDSGARSPPASTIVLTEYLTLKALHRLPNDPVLDLFERYCDRAAPAFGAMEWSWKIRPDVVLANRVFWLGSSDERAVARSAVAWLLSAMGSAPSAVADFDRVLVAYAGPNSVTGRDAVIKIYWTLNRADRSTYDRLVSAEWPALSDAPIGQGTVLHSRTIEQGGTSHERVYFMFNRADYRKKHVASFVRTVAGAAGLKMARMYPRSGLCLKRDGTDMLGIGLRPTGRRTMDPEFLMTPVMIPLVHAAVRIPHLEARLGRVTWVTVPLDEASLPRCPSEMNVYVQLQP